MSLYVVDACVAAKWFTEEQYSEQALQLLSGKDSLHAPDFLLLELDNLVCKWIRRGVITGDEGDDIRSGLRRQGMQFHPFSLLQEHAFTIAVQTGRALYDSLYVALALTLKGQMVTADRRLYDALADGPFAGDVVWIEDLG